MSIAAPKACYLCTIVWFQERQTFVYRQHSAKRLINHELVKKIVSHFITHDQHTSTKQGDPFNMYGPFNWTNQQHIKTHLAANNLVVWRLKNKANKLLLSSQSKLHFFKSSQSTFRDLWVCPAMEMSSRIKLPKRHPFLATRLPIEPETSVLWSTISPREPQ